MDLLQCWLYKFCDSWNPLNRQCILKMLLNLIKIFRRFKKKNTCLLYTEKVRSLILNLFV